MKPKLYACLFIVILSSTTSQIAFAQIRPTNVITTAVPFLRVAPDARAAGMGDIGLTTSPDANSQFYNMGKVAFNNSNNGLAFSYTPWLPELDRKSSYLLSGSYFHKLDDMQAVSVGLRYLSQGNFDLTDDLGNTTNSFKPTDLAIEAGYSRKLSKASGIGLSVRYIRSRLADESGDIKAGSTVAADLGYFYTGIKSSGSGWNFGFAFTNLGAKISYVKNSDTKDFIPANLGVGTSYTKAVNADNKITFGLDINKLLVPTPNNSDEVAMENYRNKGVVGSWFSSYTDAPGGFREEVKELQIGLGAEYMYKQQFALRAGYFDEHETKGNRKYVTVGAGFRFNVAGLDFSYLVPTGTDVNNNPLRNTFRATLMFDLNKNNTSK